MKHLSTIFLWRLAFLWSLLIAPFAQSKELAAPHFGEGVKVGEVTDSSAVLWVRLCASDQCGKVFLLPGTMGEVRVLYGLHGTKDRQETPWQAVDSDRDYTTTLDLEGLASGSSCEYVVEARNAMGEQSMSGCFRTAPSPEDAGADVLFTVTTGHKWQTIDDLPNGQLIYPAMLKLDPDFFVHTGDVVYYDNDSPPLAKNVPLARLHWHRMYNLPNQREFSKQVSTYFIKDDHDLLKDDCWPGQTYGDLTFDQGQAIFLEQTPLSKPTYRTRRWGKHLQVWMVEGRDFRSPNTMPDGPEKTIWGPEQMAWFKKTLAESDATFRILLSPTPIVGPDRTDGSKIDNHSNASFAHEGNALRKFLASQPDTFVICGDRHWQYLSVDDKTELREYSCGPSTDEHAGGWSDSNFQPEHRFLKVIGGFLSVEVTGGENPTVAFRHHDVHGGVTHKDVRQPGQGE